MRVSLDKHAIIKLYDKKKNLPADYIYDFRRIC